MPLAPGKSLGPRSSASEGSAVVALRQSYGTKEAEDRADSYISRYIYRPLSFYLTIPFVWMGCSANQVTILRLVLTLLSAALVAIPVRSLVILGAALYALCVLLDYVDGNLSRLHGTAGDFGALVEELADHVGPAVFPLAIGAGLYFRPDRLLLAARSVEPVWALFIGAFTSIAYCLAIMARLYVRLIPPGAGSPVSTATRLPVTGDHRGPVRAFQTGLQMARRGTAEGVYFAIVFGVVLAAVLDLMSIYLIARGLRNLAALFWWIWRLETRLSELRAEARD